ncbi:Hypothetical protein NocV09_00701960 [Nannochloropsis oceanica]
MALVNLTNIVVLDNPTSFTNPFTFEVTFECVQELEDDLEWKVLYVSSAENAEQDQVLEEVMVGPVPVGVNKFVLQSEPPDVSRIPEEDIIGVTVILITCSYREQEFVRVGYYVNNEYAEAFDPENPPRPVDLGKLVRNILADKPRVTRFPVDWGLGAGVEGGQQPQVTEEEAAAEGVVDFDALDQQAGDEDEEEEGGEDGDGDEDRDVGEEDSDEPGGLHEGGAMDMEMVSPAFKGSVARGDSMSESPPLYAASS